MKNINSYNDYSKKSDIHGTVLYPAVMVAPLQKEILLNTMCEMSVKNVFDPFHRFSGLLYMSAWKFQKIYNYLDVI